MQIAVKFTKNNNLLKNNFIKALHFKNKIFLIILI